MQYFLQFDIWSGMCVHKYSGQVKRLWTFIAQECSSYVNIFSWLEFAQGGMIFAFFEVVFVFKNRFQYTKWISRGQAKVAHVDLQAKGSC